MGSADKITPLENDKLQRWLKKNNSETYVITEKLDGVSLLFVKERDSIKLYTRGDGVVGGDVSYLYDYINFPVVNENINVRGELIMAKTDFVAHYKTLYKNPRNMVSGLIGSKTERKGFEHIHFVVYEIVEENGMEQSSQLQRLKELGFEIPKNKIVNKLDTDSLSKILTDFKKTSQYEIDGIIIQKNTPYKRNKNGNPSYMFAFKMLDEDSVITTKVLEIEWNISKWGQLKPVAIVEPVEISGVTIKRATVNHAKYVYENKLGKGAVVKITRSKDVIPYILEVVIPSEKADFPEIEYEWDKNNVNIVVKNEDQIMCIKLIASFFSNLGIKYISEKTVEKLYKNGLNNLIKIISISKEELLELKIEGIEEKSAKRICDNIKNGLKDVSIPKLLGASGVLGFGIGIKKIETLFEGFPDILFVYKKVSQNELVEKIQNVKGFSKITAEKIAYNIRYGDLFLKKLKKHIELKSEKKEKKGTDLTGKIFVFTGKRDKELMEKIKNQGGTISNSVSKKTTAVISDNDGEKTSKIVEAEKKNIPIYYDKSEFVREYF